MTLLDNLLSPFKKRKKVGLALSGGVARGIAHIGVLKVLKKHNVVVDFVAGTSSGSMIGALFAAGMDPETMEATAQRLGWSRFVRVVLAKHGPASTEEIQKFIIKNIGDLKFSELKIPFAVVASDLITGKEVILREGYVAKAVAASSTVPGFFVPIHHENDFLVDGGLTNNVPSSVVKSMGADFIIASDVVPAGILPCIPDNGFQIFGRTFDLAIKQLSEEGRKLADVVIEPKIPHDIWHLDFGKAKRLIACGEEAAETKILEIKTRLAL